MGKAASGVDDSLCDSPSAESGTRRLTLTYSVAAERSADLTTCPCVHMLDWRRTVAPDCLRGAHELQGKEAFGKDPD